MHENPGATIALNCIPQIDSYRSLPSLAPFSNALDDPCLGSYWAFDDSGDTFNFAGDVTKLYRLDNGVTYLDVSGPSAPYAANNWEFNKFGEQIIAVDKNTPPQKFEMGVDVNFSDLAGNPPQASTIATVRDFVVLGNLNTLGPNYVQWSGYNNSETWEPSIATQADFQALFGRGGDVQRIVPGEYGVIFTEQSIWRMDYVGPPVIFQFDEVERKRGTPAPNSVAWTGEQIYYWGWDNFYVFDGRQSTPISHNRVSRWFQLNASPGSYTSMRAAIDRRNRLVVWAFKTSDSLVNNNRLLIYNWAANRWSYGELDTQVIDEFVSPGYTLDELDGPLPLGIDLQSIPVDTDAYLGGLISLSAFDANNQNSSFSGAPLTATLETKEISGPDQKRFMVNAIRPLIEAEAWPGSDVVLQIGKRNNLRENPVLTVARPLNGLNGEFNIRENSRYQRYRFTISNGFDHAKGCKANIRVAGRR